MDNFSFYNPTRIEFGTRIAIDGRHGLLIEGNYPLREEVHILPL